MLGRVDEVELLTALYAGVHETPPWQSFLDRLRRRMRAARCWLTVGSEDPARPRETWLARAPGVAAEDASTCWPDTIRAVRLRPGRLYADTDLAALLPDADASRPIDRSVRTIRVAGPAALSGWITVARSGEDFSAAEGAVLTALAPHLAIALQTMSALEAQRHRLALGDALLDRAGLGWAWVTPDGELGAASSVARNVLARGGAHLQPEGADALRRLIESEDATRYEPVDRCIAVRSATPDIGLCKIATPPVASPASNALLLIVRAPPPEHERQAALLAQQFKLTATEAKLALLLARNLSIAEAAAMLGLTIETTRNYSKRLYFKTATRGLGELVRRVLHSVAVLG